jgi:hypothetical protein
MMLDHYQQTKNMLVSYSPKKLGFFWVGEAHELDERRDAVGGGELDGVVVIAELHAGCGDFFTNLVELVGVPFPIVHDERFGVFVGWSFAGVRADDVMQT